MNLQEERVYTIDDIFALPDGQRAELINGHIFMMAPPNFTHQRILNMIDVCICIYIQKKQRGCEVLPAPFAVFLNDEKTTYVEPDLSVICDKRKIQYDGCHGAPDWTIEIVSPSSRSMDYYFKLGEYRRSGVREYWIVDPMKEITVVYDLENEGAPVIYPFDSTIKGTFLDGFEMNIMESLQSLD